MSHYNIVESAPYFNNTGYFGYHYAMDHIFRPFAKLSEIRNIHFQNCGWPILDLKNVRFLTLIMRVALKICCARVSIFPWAKEIAFF